MLKKLIAYEWKATSRSCLPLYLGVIILAAINRLFIWANMNVLSANTDGGFTVTGTLSGIATTVYMALIIASFVVTFVVLIQRFYKSLLGDEGYLMFTLPVTVSQHIISKTVVASILSVLSGVAAFLSIMILGFDLSDWQAVPGAFWDLLKLMVQQPGWPLYLIEGIALMVLMLVSGVLSVYLCIAIGHLAKRHRIAVAICAYFGISVVLQLALTLLLLVGSSEPIVTFAMGLSPFAATQVVLIGSILGTAICTAICFVVTRYILTKRLNLE